MKQEVSANNTLERIGTFRPYKGHKIFKVNKETLEISEAEITTIPIKTKEKGKKLSKKKIIAEDGYTYVSALNIKNVKKKLLKLALRGKQD